jgi:1-acyl-sn-glycerol-3-phosphate acyltransferase
MENLPRNGAFVITTNHLGMLDVTLLYYSIHRWDVFVPVAEKWERIGFLRWLGRHLNWVFIDRFNPDLKAMRTMMSLMEKGHTLVIAPEGTRSRVGSMIEGKPGASYLAAKLQVPIVPIGLAGTEDRTVFSNLRKLRRSPVLINAGKPFTLPPSRRSPLRRKSTDGDHVSNRRPDPREVPRASMPNIRLRQRCRSTLTLRPTETMKLLLGPGPEYFTLISTDEFALPARQARSRHQRSNSRRNTFSG